MVSKMKRYAQLYLGHFKLTPLIRLRESQTIIDIAIPKFILNQTKFETFSDKTPPKVTFSKMAFKDTNMLENMYHDGYELVEIWRFEALK